MSPETLSRRAILAGAASVLALALPAVVATAAPTSPSPPTVATSPTAPDPIIAAIAEHRRLDDKQFEMWCELQETEEANPVLEREYEQTNEASHKAAWPLTTIRPATAAGAVALFTYTCAVDNLKGGEWHLLALANAAIGAKQVAHADAGLFDLGERILVAADDARNSRLLRN
jgi:hypothetical protein